MKRLKVIIGYRALSRFYALELGNPEIEAAEYIARAPIRTPYASGPTSIVWRWRGRPVVICETAQRRYEVWQVDASTPIYATEEAAESAYVLSRTAGAR